MTNEGVSAIILIFTFIVIIFNIIALYFFMWLVTSLGLTGITWWGGLIVFTTLYFGICSLIYSNK